MSTRRLLQAAMGGTLCFAGYSLAQITRVFSGVPATSTAVVAQALVVIVQSAACFLVLHLAIRGASR